MAKNTFDPSKDKIIGKPVFVTTFTNEEKGTKVGYRVCLASYNGGPVTLRVTKVYTKAEDPNTWHFTRGGFSLPLAEASKVVGTCGKLLAAYAKHTAKAKASQAA